MAGRCGAPIRGDVLEFLEENATDADKRGGLDPLTVLLLTVVLEPDRSLIGEVGDEHIVDEFFAVEDDRDVFFQDGDLEAVP